MIDTHIHVWNFSKAKYDWLENDTSILNRNYNIDEIEEERKALDIDKGVLVQASNRIEDTTFMLEVANENDWIKGIVGWLPLMDTDACEKIISSQYMHQPLIKGFRHLIHDEADPRWLLQPQVIRSLQLIASYNYTYDVVGVLTEHIETVFAVADKVPGLKMVFDHLNHPPLDGKKPFNTWAELMKQAAANPNLYAKISGLGTITNKPGLWNENDIQPAVEFALQHFGEDRCFCGGDWPVSLLAGSYTYTWDVYKGILEHLLPSSSLTKIYDDNAQNFYRL